jgi:hypothetical protein
MHEHISQQKIAEDILEYCKKAKKKFLTAKYVREKIISKERKRPYTSCELAAGLRYAKKEGAIERVSNNRWIFKRYELRDVK